MPFLSGRCSLQHHQRERSIGQAHAQPRDRPRGQALGHRHARLQDQDHPGDARQDDHQPGAHEAAACPDGAKPGLHPGARCPGQGGPGEGEAGHHRAVVPDRGNRQGHVGVSAEERERQHAPGQDRGGQSRARGQGAFRHQPAQGGQLDQQAGRDEREAGQDGAGTGEGQASQHQRRARGHPDAVDQPVPLRQGRRVGAGRPEADRERPCGRRAHAARRPFGRDDPLRRGRRQVRLRQGVVHQRRLHVRPRGDIQPVAVLRREDEPDVREHPARGQRRRRRLRVGGVCAGDAPRPARAGGCPGGLDARGVGAHLPSRQELEGDRLVRLRLRRLRDLGARDEQAAVRTARHRDLLTPPGAALPPEGKKAPTVPMPSYSSPRESASLADLFRVMRQRWALVALIAGLVLATTLAVTAFLPRWYLATAKVRVEKPEGEVRLFQAQSSGVYDPYFLQDQVKIMQEEKILYPVIDRLGLNTKLAAAVGAPGAALERDVSYRYLVGRMLRVESQRSSSLIEINVLAQQPALAADIANEIAREYSDDRIALATSQQREGLAQLERELAQQEGAVTRQRDAVEKLRKDLNISGVDLNAKYSDMEIETLRQMQNSLIALRVDAIGRKTRWDRFKAIPVEDRMGLVNSELIPDQNIQNLLQAYLIADQKVAQLKGRLGEAHPDLVSATENRAKMKEQLEALLRGYESALAIAYKEAEARVDELESQLSKAKVDQILSARERRSEGRLI